ncbi:succinate dehydrogenase cytochrome b subunit [Aurantibacter crassamenti]|uniref:succinate dehydrogenase cytochrome b subunit n=1 Tax=Aurantibacter crassamenti TaxID=1837375 RepID=UPI0019395914|nr:succinate dehydrogenase cytochrome b subunit [Aurantibacter crassamenti]MBM1105320.1 succinate dehydrogenase cytochrome b subunit [Aurantibacter crassamenti]
MSGLIKSSIARKVVMALSGLFLVFFLGQHLFINLTAIIDPDTFNTLSHFMGYNPLVQFILQPVLIAGVVIHFIMGFVLELQNKKARGVKYAKYGGSTNASWASRNMLISGAVILAFLGLHLYDFWFPEMAYKYIESNPEDATRYFPELAHKFHSPVRTGVYCLAFVLLMLHLWHGFSSAFQSMGVNNKYSTGLRKFTQIYAIVIPLGFIVIALCLHFSHL